MMWRFEYAPIYYSQCSGHARRINRQSLGIAIQAHWNSLGTRERNKLPLVNSVQAVSNTIQRLLSSRQALVNSLEALVRNKLSLVNSVQAVFNTIQRLPSSRQALVNSLETLVRNKQAPIDSFMSQSMSIVYFEGADIQNLGSWL